MLFSSSLRFFRSIKAFFKNIFVLARFSFDEPGSPTPIPPSPPPPPPDDADLLDVNIEGSPLISFFEECAKTFSLHAFHFNAACRNLLGWCGKSNKRNAFF
jgi:hypothetical protein